MRRVDAAGEVRLLLRSPAGIGTLLALAGLGVWIGLSIIGGLLSSEPEFRLREAWDTPVYFYVGLPVMALAVGAAGFLHPCRVWRWPLALVAGHQLGVLLVGVGMQSAPSLVILTIILAIMMSAALAVPALLGAVAARHLAERAY